RSVALDALGSICGPKDDASAEILRDALTKDHDALCRQMAAVGLGRCGHPSAGPALVAALKAKSPQDRIFVLLGLALRVRATPDVKVSEMLAREVASTSNQDERAAATIACGLANVQSARGTIMDSVPKSRSTLSTSSACF